MRQLGLEEGSSTEAIVRAVVAKLFGVAPDHGSGQYETVDVHTGLTLAAYAWRGPRFLELLGWIGSGGELIPTNKRLSNESMAPLKRSLLLPGEDYVVIVNVNDTGTWYPVDPAPKDDLSELLVAFYSNNSLTALYWGAPID